MTTDHRSGVGGRGIAVGSPATDPSGLESWASRSVLVFAVILQTLPLSTELISPLPLPHGPCHRPGLFSMLLREQGAASVEMVKHVFELVLSELVGRFS